MQESGELKQRIINNANQCVKCGLCAPHCPTYGLTLNENESARGRITLADNLAQGNIPLTEVTRKHLDHCLTCRACEAACPSDVKYGEIIDDLRQLTFQQRPPTAVYRQLTWLLSKPWRSRAAQRFLYCLQKTGVLWLLSQVGVLRLLHQQRLASFLPKLTWPRSQRQTLFTTKQASRGRIGLFLGCINQWCDQPVYAASIQLLNALGYDVVIPKQQTCCGAIWQHAGDHAQFQQQQQQNQQAFANVDAVVTIASGCTVSLHDYLTPLPKVWEITAFIADALSRQSLTFHALDKTVAIHVPCTQRNVLKTSGASQQCLAHIPDLKMVNVTESKHCCGAAGLNMLQHPETADPLVEKTLAQLEQLAPDYLVTTNIGCNLQFQRYLKQKGGGQKPVLHPVQLLAQQLN